MNNYLVKFENATGGFHEVPLKDLLYVYNEKDTVGNVAYFVVLTNRTVHVTPSGYEIARKALQDQGKMHKELLEALKKVPSDLIEDV
jgi:hypothetical protein